MKQLEERQKTLPERIAWILRAMLFLISVVAPLMIIYEFGYPVDKSTLSMLHDSYRGMLTMQWLIITLLYVGGVGSSQRRSLLAHSVTRSVVYSMVTAIVLLNLSLVFGWLESDWLLGVITSNTSVRLAVLVVSTAQISRSITGLLGKRTNPSLILAVSFACIIIVGTLLLMLPRSTIHEVDISWIDALFVSTSAVCVTGLSPLDVASTFTMTGQVVILILIQIGGLGIMTITSFFGLFFSGSRSFSGQMVVGDMLSTERLSSLLSTIIRIIAVTLSIEAIGAVFLYMAAMNGTTMSTGQAIYFGIFHSISAFCNAGFSTLAGNLADPLIAALNSVRWVIGVLIICGGIGFPIFSNFLSFLAHKFRNLLRRIYGLRSQVRPHLWRLNSYIVVRTTLFLIVGAFVAFLALEWNASLAGMPLLDKLSNGFILSVSPRTAGFNSIELGAMLPASVMLTIFLMWIGGAPQSTAGGIKVTTAYVAFNNIISSAQGRGALNINHRQVVHSSVERAFGVIILSMLTISVAVMLLSLFDPEIELIHLVFEAVSAVSTVGLSLNTTPLLSDYSKIIVILLMFAGRVGLVAMLMIFVRNTANRKPYTYPEENILIN